MEGVTLSMRVGGTGREIWDDDNQFEGDGDEEKIKGLEETMEDGKNPAPGPPTASAQKRADYLFACWDHLLSELRNRDVHA
jgi:hypothetical protein